MAPLTQITRRATRALRLGRGLADRAVRVAAPRLARVAGEVAERLPTRRRTPAPSTPTTFAPSRATTEQGGAASDSPAPPTPGTVAHNIAQQRPTARPAPKRPPRKSAPGAKLPPPRPRATS